MLRYEEGLLVESFSRRPESFTIDHQGRRESLLNRLRLLFRGGGEGCTVVHMGRDVTGGSQSSLVHLNHRALQDSQLGTYGPEVRRWPTPVLLE